MSNQGAAGRSRRRSISEFGPSRLNRTSFEDELFVDNGDLSLLIEIICSTNLNKRFLMNCPRGVLICLWWVGTGTGRLPAGVEQQASIQSQFNIICENIAAWQREIDEEPISFEGIQSQFVNFKGLIYYLYQNALCSRVTDKLSYHLHYWST